MSITPVCYRAYDHAFRLIGAWDALTDHLRRVLSPAAPERDLAGSMTLRFHSLPDSGGALQPEWTRPQVQDGRFRLTLDRRVLVEVSEADLGATAWIEPGWLARSPEAVEALLIEAPVLVLLAWCRMPFVHAAAVVRRGQGYLLVGGSGSGKSSLAYALVREGFELLAEDYVFVRSGPDGPELLGSPRSLRLLPDARQIFPELTDRPIRRQVNGELKIETMDPPRADRLHRRARLAGITLLEEPEGSPAEEAVLAGLTRELQFDPAGLLRRHREGYRRLARTPTRGLPMATSPIQRAHRFRRLWQENE